MDLPVHDQILWHACVLASQRLGGGKIADPLEYFPVLVRGSWINDTNQVTAFTDFFTGGGGAPTPLATMDDAVRTVFAAYWRMQLASVLSRVSRVDASLADRCRSRVEDLTHVADFGSYTCHDHLDVLEDLPASEYVDNSDHALAKTVAASRKFIGTRLFHSTTRDDDPDARKDGVRVSALGRALHSIADFFAHTNFVELLLWELAAQGAIDGGMIDYFNRSAKAYPFEPGLDEGFYTPLPRNKSERPEEREDALRAAMWYGEAPATTPLVSCVFDTQDTAFSLVHLYANHLEQTRPESIDDEQLNLVFSIIDVSGAPIPLQLLRSIATISIRAKELLDAAGRGARKFLAKTLVSTAEGLTSNPTARGLLRTAGSLIEHYHAGEASEWARAGKLRYVAHAVATDLGERLAKTSREGKPGLPHHSLLSKDHSPHRLDERVRFNLACFLATELSAEVLAWHFSPQAHDDFFPELRDRYLIHPGRMLGGTGFDAKKIGELAQSFFRGSWQGSLDHSRTLATWSHA